jgi:hypothetical protein
MSWKPGTIVVRIGPTDNTDIIRGEMIHGNYYTVRGSRIGVYLDMTLQPSIWVNEVTSCTAPDGTEWSFVSRDFRIAETSVSEIVTLSEKAPARA